VQTWNAAGYGPWSADLTFTVRDGYCLSPPTAAPGVTTLTAPSDCADSTTPLLTWDETADASWYRVYLRHSDGTVVLDQWYAWWEAACNGSQCAVTAPSLTEDAHCTWWVQPWSEYGYGPWSASLTFQVNNGYCLSPPTGVPEAVTLIEPSGCVEATAPTLTWTETPNASWYRVYVRRADLTVVQDQWYAWWQLACDDTQCAVSTPSLTEATYTWWVQPWGEYGYGPWSAGLTFEVAASCPLGSGVITPEPVTFQKAGSGDGTIQVGSQVCGPTCASVQVPYADYAEMTVIPDADSYFVRLEREDGTPLNTSQFDVQPGETIIVVFEQNN
jgi:hypothetical protein